MDMDNAGQEFPATARLIGVAALFGVVVIVNVVAWAFALGGSLIYESAYHQAAHVGTVGTQLITGAFTGIIAVLALVVGTVAILAGGAGRRDAEDTERERG